MATQTLINYLETTQQDGFGASVDVGLAAMNRRQVETFKADAALAAGEWVALSLGDGAGAVRSDGVAAISVRPSDLNDAGGLADTTSISSIIVGVVLGPASSRDDDGAGGVKSGGQALVCTRGICNAQVDDSGAAITRGSALGGSNDAGHATAYAAASTFGICGYLIDPVAGGGAAGTAVSVSVYVMPSLT
jgi:hypothetical protein